MLRLTKTIGCAGYLAALLTACEPGPRTDSQTNWLRTCETDADCGELRCRCGACTWSCGDDTNCAHLPGTSCVPADDSGPIALCGGSRPPSLGLCLPRCPAQECAEGTSCVAGVCVPTPAPTTVVLLDESQRFQELVGIGAAIGYTFEEIVQHPRKNAVLDAMFSGTGFSMLRLRNRYGLENEGLESSGEIVAAAAERLGRTPTIALTSGSPPGALKANGSNWCEGNPDTCTLAKLPDGSFDYPGFASHWRGTLDAYALAGIVPDYISIQNNPNWVPPAGEVIEACRFLPTQGMTTVATDAGDVEVEYPGYAEALDAVFEQLAGLASVPKIIAPETTGFAEVGEYVNALDMTKVDALAHHLYGTDTSNLDLAALAALGERGRERQRPLFQSEMYADPLTTAVLMHAALAVEGAAVYVHNGFVASVSDTEPEANNIINLTADGFTVGDVYHVMRHYAAHISPGWTRVAADTDPGALLTSAWRSPAGDTVVVVLTNPGITEVVAQLETDPELAPAEVTRTVLTGLERSTELGATSPDGVVRLPAHAIATVVLRR